MKLKKYCKIILLVMVMVLVTACGNSDSSEDANVTAESEKVVLRVGSNKAIGTVTPYIAEKLGYFEGKDYEVVITDFTDGSSMMEAMAAGELDICFVGIAPVAIWNGKGIDIRVIASANTGGHVILTRENTGIESVEDLKGKSMTIPNIGTVTDTILKSYILPKYGLTESDMTLVPGVKAQDMVTMLVASEEVDAIMTWEPYATMAELTYDNIEVIFDVPKEWQEETESETLYPVNVISADGIFCDKHPNEVKDFLAEIEKTVAYIKVNSEKGVSLISEVLGLEEAVVNKSLERSQLTFDVDVDASLNTLQWAYDAGFLDEMPDKDKLFDLSFVSDN